MTGHEIHVVVPGVRGDLSSRPVGNDHRNVGLRELDLGEDEPIVLAAEDVDLPGKSVVRYPIPRLSRWGFLQRLRGWPASASGISYSNSARAAPSLRLLTVR